MSNPKEGNGKELTGLTSRDLAELIVDALVYPDIVKKTDYEKAVQIATEEINARKAVGDY